MDLQCLLGLKCNDFSMIAADQMKMHNIFVMKDDEEKLHNINDRMLLGMIGDTGDTAQFLQYLKRNIQLYRVRNAHEMSVGSVAHFAKRNLAEASLQLHAYTLNLLVAGFDPKEGGQLYQLDELGSCMNVPSAACGFGGLLTRSIMDRYHKPVMTEQEAYEVLKLCTEEIQKRLIVQLPKFQVAVVSKDGVKQLPQLQRSN